MAAKGPLPVEGAKGYFVPPRVFAEVAEDDELFSRELFGPILVVVKAPDFDAALELALQSEYELTGAGFSRSPKHLRQVAREFCVGNLYLNRGCPGALVHRQLFGRAKMSGVGSKAGSPDYLLQFIIPRTVSENTMRQGFSPLDG